MIMLFLRAWMVSSPLPHPILVTVPVHVDLGSIDPPALSAHCYHDYMDLS